MLEIIEDSTLKRIKNIRHGFFTRLGGVSTGIYASLNCAYPSNDDIENVHENRRLAMACFRYPLDALISVRNVHSNIAVIAEAWQEQQKPDADAIVTTQSHIMLGSDSADCPIILLADDKNRVIGLAHAGWRGAKDGIIEATVEKMISLGGQYHHISAAISPCIAQNSYEVSSDFREQFLQDSRFNQKYFKNSDKQSHYLFNLLGYVKDRLFKLNLKSVSSETAIDTYTNEKHFFSCRRALHKKEMWFGGHLSCIGMME